MCQGEKMNTSLSSLISKPSSPSEPLRIDGHAHVFLKSLPMAKERRYTPRYDALPKRYFELLKEQGLNGALLVQPSFLGTDNSYLLEVLAMAKRTLPTLWLRGVVVLDPSTTEEEMWVLKVAGIVGIRLNYLSRPLPDLDSPPWSTYLDRVQTVGWHVEVHVEGHRLASILDRLTISNRHVIIDHFGLPAVSSLTECSGFQSIINNRYSGVCVKISAPYRVFPQLPSDQAARECGKLARVLLDSIGPERLIWGSDWPWTKYETGLTYARCLKWVTDWYSGVSVIPESIPDWLIGDM
jgi:predicted TIM-barrel fold metal-dependent hydrolase